MTDTDIFETTDAGALEIIKIILKKILQLL